MTKVQQLEKAVISLPEDDYGRFRRWFLENDWAKWDAQIQADSKSGKLDFLIEEAAEAKKHKCLKAL